jgi:hypothetical protein
LIGLYLGVRQGIGSISRIVDRNLSRALAMLPPALFALAAANILFKLCMG